MASKVLEELEEIEQKQKQHQRQEQRDERAEREMLREILRLLKQLIVLVSPKVPAAPGSVTASLSAVVEVNASPAPVKKPWHGRNSKGERI